MIFQRWTYRGGFVQADEPEDGGEYGVVEVEYNDGRVEELELNDIKQLTLHVRYPEVD